MGSWAFGTTLGVVYVIQLRWLLPVKPEQPTKWALVGDSLRAKP